ncbi:MAG: efflux RND transporter periplasmic adaptor subunit [bacterium]|nr:efflux RND transporter periplasmic adaptor subunit [bacterium]
MKYVKKKRILIIVAVAVLVTGGLLYFFVFKSKAPTYDFVTAQKGALLQKISVTAKIKPAENVALAFEKSGKVSRVYVNVGDKVKTGQFLASLNSAEPLAELAQTEANLANTQAQLAQYEAALETQNAKLAEIKKGTRQEEIQIQEAKVENAQVALDESKKNLVDKLQDAFTKSDDAIRNKTDQLFDNPRGTNPQLKVSTSDASLKTSIENGRVSAEFILNLWKKSTDELTTASDFDSAVSEADKNLSDIKLFLDKIASAVNNLAVSTSLTQTTIDSWRSDISTARTNLNTAVVNLSSAAEKFKTAKTSLAVSQNELTLKKAGNTFEQIAAQEAQVREAAANVLGQKAKIQEAEAKIQAARAQLAQNTIQSPINGIVTKQDAKIGEIAQANENLISVISEANFQIEASVAEADIAKLKVGDTAELTLDAYGNSAIFSARVIKIDPAETTIEGVPTYKTTLELMKEDERIKSGMTANVDILTDKRENIVKIPQRAVITRDTQKFARIFENDKITERKIETGMKGSDGNIEIISGISEGEKVITFIKNG